MKLLVLLGVCVGLAWSASIGASNGLGEGLSRFGPLFNKQSAVQKEPCCMPDKWEGILGEEVEYASSPSVHGRMLIMEALAVDGENQKVAANMFVEQKAGPMNLTVIVDYNNHVMYVADVTKRTCQKSLVEGQMAKQCLPKDSHYVGSVRMGYGDTNSLEGDVWGIKVEQKSPVLTEMFIHIIVTPDLCIPVTESGGGLSSDVKVHFGASFFNISPKISHPDIFTPPSFCHTEVEEVPLKVVQMNPMVATLTKRFSKP